ARRSLVPSVEQFVPAGNAVVDCAEAPMESAVAAAPIRVAAPSRIWNGVMRNLLCEHLRAWKHAPARRFQTKRYLEETDARSGGSGLRQFTAAPRRPGIA